MADNDNKNPKESHPVDRYNPGNQAGKGPTLKEDEPKRENKGDEEHREKQSRQ